MISRVADHCFWMSRYLERAENTARVLEVNQTLLLDFPVPLEQQWQPLLIISGIHDMPKDADGETVQNHLTWETSNPASIVELDRGGPRERAEHPRGHQRRELGKTQLLLSLDSEQPGAGALSR